METIQLQTIQRETWGSLYDPVSGKEDEYLTKLPIGTPVRNVQYTGQRVYFGKTPVYRLEASLDEGRTWQPFLHSGDLITSSRGLIK